MDHRPFVTPLPYFDPYDEGERFLFGNSGEKFPSCIHFFAANLEDASPSQYMNEALKILKEFVRMDSAS